MDEGNAHRGYDVILEGGKVCSHFVNHWPDKAFKVMSKQPVFAQRVASCGSDVRRCTKSHGMKIYVDGQPQEFDVTTNNTLDGTLTTDKPFHIGRRFSSAPFRGRIDDVRVFSTALSAEDAALLAKGESLSSLKEILAVAPTERTTAQNGPHQSLLPRSGRHEVESVESRVGGDSQEARRSRQSHHGDDGDGRVDAATADAHFEAGPVRSAG